MDNSSSKINDAFSKDNTNCLKGICSLLILIHHLSQNMLCKPNTVFPFLDNLGFLAVSVFFFISGYGLISRYMETEGKYIQGFAKKRILTLYIDNLILVVIYSVFYLALQSKISIKLLLLSLTFGGTVVKYGWYIQVILLFYIVFYFSALIFKTPKKIFISAVLTTAIYFVICYMVKFGDWWYVSLKSVFAYSLGMGFAVFSSRIKYFFSSRKKLIIIFVILVFLFLIIYNINYLCPFIPEIIKYLVCSLLFPCILLILPSIVNIRCKLTEILSGLYYEIYAIQGLFILLFHSDILYIKNDVLYVLITVISIIAASFLLKAMLTQANKVIKRI